VSKTITKFLLMDLLFIFIFLSNSFAQQDPLDPYGLDSVLFEQRCSYIDSSSCSGKVVISTIIENDEVLAAFTFPFHWTGPLFLDSVSFTGTRAEPMQAKFDTIDNVQNILVCAAVAYLVDQTIKPGRGPAVNLFFTATDTGTVTIDTLSIVLGTFYDLRMDTDEGSTFTPQFEKGIFHIESSDVLLGDANLDDSVNLSDVIHLARYLLKSGSEPGYFPCSYTNADMNADCLINLSDVIYLANYLLKSGPPPQVGY